MQKLNLLNYHLILIILSAWLLSACSKPDERIYLTQSSVVVAFGDSLTRGKGTSEENSYPSVLKNLLGVEVINEGISGEVSSKGLARLENVLQKHTPDLVVLCHGGNDILKKLPLADLERNLEAMISLIQSKGAKVILVGVPKPSLSLSSLDLYENLADKHNLVSDLDILSDLLEQRSMKSDKVHLNAQGYRALATAISKKIEVL